MISNFLRENMNIIHKSVNCRDIYFMRTNTKSSKVKCYSLKRLYVQLSISLKKYRLNLKSKYISFHFY